MRNTSNNQTDRIMSWAEVCERVGLSRTQLWRKTKEGSFPPPLQISTRRVGWRWREIESWLDGRQPVEWAPPDNAGIGPSDHSAD